MKILWTDGSANPNPGPGGFAVIEKQADGTGKPVKLGNEPSSTNIRMEGLAMIAAIKYAGDEPCEIHSDSEFWLNVLTKWAPGWARNDWHKSSDKILDNKGNFVKWKPSSIKNLDIVQELYELYQAHDVKLIWVKGHAGAKFNELADYYANEARKTKNVV